MLMQVPWLERANLERWYAWLSPFSSRITISSAVTRVTTPFCLDSITTPESQAALYSMPVPTMGASGLSSGTA